MSLQSYNNAELAILKAVKDDLRWHLGVELGHDPQSDPRAIVELEMRFAAWLLNGGGAWLRSLPQINRELD